MCDDCLTREDLLERVTLPLGNMAHVLETYTDHQQEINPVALKVGLHRVHASIADIHEFLLGLTKTMEERREPRTPEELRTFVAENTDRHDCQVVDLPVLRLEDIARENLTAKGG